MMDQSSIALSLSVSSPLLNLYSGVVVAAEKQAREYREYRSRQMGTLYSSCDQSSSLELFFPWFVLAFLRFAQHSRVDRWWRFYDESNFVQQRDQEGFMLQSETPLVSVLNQLLVFVQRHASVCTLGSRRGCASRRASRSMRSRC